ncbi:hypothetical protein H4219_002020 [Mycoemilia scoparia]|uniref:DUF726-domain-containing protein n=1 Tax=Mycoemilia scoparia TaxID=417184 RepID=A0A9W8A6U9_9FUNG|nr:hypothetical protein H4219_002020 [Mycoemilia scoparia]
MVLQQNRDDHIRRASSVNPSSTQWVQTKSKLSKSVSSPPPKEKAETDTQKGNLGGDNNKFWRVSREDGSNMDIFDVQFPQDNNEPKRTWFSSLMQSSKRKGDDSNTSLSSMNDYYQTLEDANNTVEVDTRNDKMSISTIVDSKIENNSRMMSMMHEEELRLLEAERQEKRSVIQSILTDEQKIAYVGLVYLTLIEMQERLGVQFKEGMESTGSFLNFSRRIMQRVYYHISLSSEEQRMIELLPRHKITTEDMKKSLLGPNNKGGIVEVKTNQHVAVSHAGVVKNPDSVPNSPTLPDTQKHNSSESMTEIDLHEQKEDIDLSPISTKEDRHWSPEKAEVEERIYLNERSIFSQINDNDLDDNPFYLDHELPTHNDNKEADNDNEDKSMAIFNGTSIWGDNDPELRKSPIPGTSTSQLESVPSPDLSPEKAKSSETPLSPKSSSKKIQSDEPKINTLSEQSLMIDIRASIILDFFLLLLDNDVYDGRGRYLLRRLAEVLEYPWTEVLACERRITTELSLYDYAAEISVEGRESAATVAKRQADKGKIKRYVVMGLVTAGGGLVMGLSAGLLAPAIGAGIGATLGAIGLAHGGAFFGSVGGTALIASTGVLTGTGLAGFKIARRTKGAQDFQFIPQVNEQQTNIVLTIPGWLGKSDNGTFSFSSIDKINGDHYSLLWEQDDLRRLGSSLRIIASEVIQTTVMATLQYTVLPSLLGPLSVPLWLVKLGYILDNPWTTCCDLAKKAGPIIAEVLLQRVQGYRPVTLVGYSVGARLIFYCLLELARMNAYGIIEDVYLFGAPVVESKEQWRLAASVIGGRFINGYSNRDWILGFFYRTAKLSGSVVAGLAPIEDINAITNIDISDDIPGHNAYFTMMPVLLDQVGIIVDSTQLNDPDDNGEVTAEERELQEDIHKAAAEIESKERKKWWAFWGGSGASAAAAAGVAATSGKSSQSKSEELETNSTSLYNSNETKESLSAPPQTYDQPRSPKDGGSDDNDKNQGIAKGHENDLEFLAKEFEELGIPFKRVETTLPTLVLDPNDKKPDSNQNES